MSSGFRVENRRSHNIRIREPTTIAELAVGSWWFLGVKQEVSMITRARGGRTYVAKCDGCGEEIDTGQTSFHQAVVYISRAEEWHNERPRGVWNNYCPRCAGAADDIDIVGIGFTKRPVIDE
jgi:hypothetical protein